MAGSHTSDAPYVSPLPGLKATRLEASRRKRRHGARMAIAAGICLIAAPVAVTAVLPDTPKQAVELDAAIMDFSREGAVINLSLMAADGGQRVYVEDAANNILEIPVSPGQTSVTAQLPANFVTSEALIVRVH